VAEPPPAGAGGAAAGVSAAERELLEQFKPYSPVRLCNLVKNMELNEQCGIVVPPGCSLSPEVPGCLKVRLEYGREVAVKPQNVQLLAVPAVSAMGGQAQGMPLASQEQVLQQVLARMQAETAGQALAAAAPPAPAGGAVAGPWGLM